MTENFILPIDNERFTLSSHENTSIYPPPRTAYHPLKATKTEPAAPPVPTTPNQRSGDRFSIPKAWRDVNPILRELKNYAESVPLPEITAPFNPTHWNPENFYTENIERFYMTSWDPEHPERALNAIIKPSERDLLGGAQTKFVQGIQYYLAALVSPLDGVIVNVDGDSGFRANSFCCPSNTLKGRKELFERGNPNAILHFSSFKYSDPQYYWTFRPAEIDIYKQGFLAEVDSPDVSLTGFDGQLVTKSTPDESNKIRRIFKELGFTEGEHFKIEESK